VYKIGEKAKAVSKNANTGVYVKIEYRRTFSSMDS
jgi:hypothetical protein